MLSSWFSFLATFLASWFARFAFFTFAFSLSFSFRAAIVVIVLAVAADCSDLHCRFLRAHGNKTFPIALGNVEGHDDVVHIRPLIADH